MDTKNSKSDEKPDNKKELNKKESQKKLVKDLTDILQRLQADFENYKRRTDKEKQEFTKYSNMSLIKKLLPLLDNYELGLKNTSNQEDFLKGMELIYSQFVTILKEEGVEKINTENQKFDPVCHEALMAEEKPEVESNTIIEEFQSGYKIQDKILRPSKVKVAK